MGETTRFVSKVSQSGEPELMRGSEDELVIRLRVNRNVSGRFSHPKQHISTHCFNLGQREIKVSFSQMKQQLQLTRRQGGNSMKEYEDDILKALKEINFHREKRVEMVEEIFKVVEEAVSPEIPIVAVGAYASFISGTGDDVKAMLKPVRIKLTEKSDSCAICFNDLLAEQEHDLMWDLTRLPCQHLFHKDCIRPWLYKNHTCPACRYNIPTDDDDDDDNSKRGLSFRFRPY